MQEVTASEQEVCDDTVVEIGGKKAKVIPFSPPKFDVTDPAGYTYFQENGYTVFRNVATQQEIEQGKYLFWKYMKASFPLVERDALGKTTTGLIGLIIMADGIGNSEFTWFCRGIPKQIFSTVWKGEEDLVVSMDAAGVTRPPEERYNPDFATLSGWFHFDQNGFNKKGFHCAQGLLNFFPSGPQDGGLILLPRTHSLFDNLFETRKQLGDKFGSDFVKISKADLVPEVWTDPAFRPIKLCLEPGDFAVWDSRTAHCNHPATAQATVPPTPDLKRLVCYICMTPLKNAGANSSKIAKKRLIAFRDGLTTSHWPHEYQPRGRKCDKQPEFSLNNHQKELLVGKELAATLGDGPLSSKNVPNIV